MSVGIKPIVSDKDKLMSWLAKVEAQLFGFLAQLEDEPVPIYNCPECGLQLSEEGLAEHLHFSPLHRRTHD